VKAIVLIAIAALADIVRAFILMWLWNWTVVSIFPTAKIDFWAALGLMWIAHILTFRPKIKLD
jgi:hypothetical protein